MLKMPFLFIIANFGFAIFTDAQTAKDYTQEGFIQLKLKDDKRALANFYKAIELDSMCAHAYFGLAHFYDSTARIAEASVNYSTVGYQKAIKNYSRAIEYDSDLIHREGYYILRALCKDQLNDSRGVIEDCDKAIQLNPKADAYRLRGYSHLGLGENVEAKSDFTKALVINPKDQNSYRGRGAAKANLNDNLAAIADFTRAIELDHQFANAFFSRGLSYAELHDHRRAISDFTKAAEIDPQNEEAYYYRGLSRIQLHDIKGACLDFDHAEFLGIGIKVKKLQKQYCK